MKQDMPTSGTVVGEEYSNFVQASGGGEVGGGSHLKCKQLHQHISEHAFLFMRTQNYHQFGAPKSWESIRFIFILTSVFMIELTYNILIFHNERLEKVWSISWYSLLYFQHIHIR